MKSLTEPFTNWVRPSEKQIAQEYKVEYQMKNLKSITDDAFPAYDEFRKAMKSAKKLTVTKAINKNIAYRSNTRSQSALLSLIKSYRSYPEFRNEKTLQDIYDGFRENREMTCPIVLKFKDGSMRVMAGNTRMDVAFQLGINPVVILLKIP